MSPTAVDALSGTPQKTIVITCTGIKLGYYLACRVGKKGSTWEQKGSNDGAISDPAIIPPEVEAEGGGSSSSNITTGNTSIQWNVYDTFKLVGLGGTIDDLELTIRIMSRAGLLGSESIAEIKLDIVTIKNKIIEVPTTSKVTTEDGSTPKAKLSISMGPPGSNYTAGSNNTIPEYPRTYPCGTNHFGTMPSSSSSVVLQSKGDLKNCIIWGAAHECMTSWVTCHFIYHNVAFQSGDKLCASPATIPMVKDHKDIDVRASLSGAKSGYGSAQLPDSLVSNSVPMLQLTNNNNNNNKQQQILIQDGVIINHHILPILYGTDVYTQQVLEWEKKIGYEYIPAMWRDLIGVDYCNIFKRLLCNYPSAFKVTWNPFMRWPVLIPPKVMAIEIGKIRNYIGEDVYDKHRTTTTMKSILQEFSTTIKNNANNSKFISGKDKPGPTDVSFYGINVIYYMTDIGPARDVITQDPILKTWMEAMLKEIPPSKCLKMEYFGPSMSGWKGGWLLDPPQFDPIPDESNIDTSAIAAATAAAASSSTKKDSTTTTTTGGGEKKSAKAKLTGFADKAKLKMGNLAGDAKKKSGTFMAKQMMKNKFG